MGGYRGLVEGYLVLGAGLDEELAVYVAQRAITALGLGTVSYSWRPAATYCPATA